MSSNGAGVQVTNYLVLLQNIFFGIFSKNNDFYILFGPKTEPDWILLSVSWTFLSWASFSFLTLRLQQFVFLHLERDGALPTRIQFPCCWRLH